MPAELYNLYAQCDSDREVLLARRIHTSPRLQRYALALIVGGIGSALCMTAPATVARLVGAAACIGTALLIVADIGWRVAGTRHVTQVTGNGPEPEGDLGPAALRRAIERDELMLHYQPIVSGTTLQIVGLEALLRWQHPTRGLVMPASFIGLAEESGEIGAVGQWVLRRACQDGRRWPGLSIAVNVSPVQVRQADFVAGVAAVLAETGFAANRLQIELTESVVIDDAAQAEGIIIDLQTMGIRVAIDDFGTGYSSLIYLRRFAFDKMKIDKSFVQLLDESGESAVIISSIVKLGQALGLTITAEGIETPQQQVYLRTLGCHEFQGYLYSPPVAADEIDALLSTKRWMDEERQDETVSPRSVA